MRQFLLLVLIVLLGIGFTACGDDDNGDGNVLRLDGDNFSAPTLDAGEHEFAVRFDENELARFDGRNLVGLRVFVGNAPASLRFNAYVGGITAPDSLVRTVNNNANLANPEFRDYRFGTPLVIDASQTLWLGAEVVLDQDEAQSIGCDAPGNGVDGGQWLYDDAEGWQTFVQRGGENVNWNIRGIVE